MTPTHIVRIHRPDITEEERSKRLAAIKRAAEKLVAETLIHKRKEKTP
jgi:hypothetical protein